MSSLKSLFEHRKTKAHLEFKSTKWKEERMYLRIHVRNLSVCHLHGEELLFLTIAFAWNRLLRRSCSTVVCFCNGSAPQLSAAETAPSETIGSQSRPGNRVEPPAPASATPVAL